MSRLLVVDAGNTRVKWALAVDPEPGARWSAQGSVPSADAATLGAALPGAPPERVFASNVAGAGIEHALAAAFPGADLRWARTEAARCGVTNGYRNPAQLGADRWAAAIAAHNLAGAAACAKLVVMAGTATTIDAVAADGRFLGGIIVPGITLMHDALHLNTAQLAGHAGVFEPIPRDTANAISSGAIHATAGAIERMHALVRAGMAPQSAPGELVCVVSGGAAHLIAPHLPFPAAIEDNLVLQGLVLIARDIFR